MPLPVAHGFLGAACVAALIAKPFKLKAVLPFFSGAVLANLADFDFLLVFATENKEWHRGFTHSIIFSIFTGLLFFLYFGRNRWREAAAFSLAYASHFFLDFITTKIGSGIEVFFPFTNQRYGLRLFGLSEYPSKMWVFEIIQTLTIEFIIFFSLFVLIVFARRTFSKDKQKP